MKILIDSHILIWLLYEPEKISPEAQNVLQTAEAVYLSIISLWELSLKFSKNKLAYAPEDLVAGVQALNLDRLPLKDKHLLLLPDICMSHKDPFDSLLIAQSESESCTFLTADTHVLNSEYNTVNC